MSIQRVIIRCDEPGCILTADITLPHELDGWRQLVTPGFNSHTEMLFDYCPEHESKHR